MELTGEQIERLANRIADVMEKREKMRKPTTPRVAPTGADTYLRGLSDEVLASVDWSNQPEALYTAFKRAWADSNAFANASGPDVIGMNATGIITGSIETTSLLRALLNEMGDTLFELDKLRQFKASVPWYHLQHLRGYAMCDPVDDEKLQRINAVGAWLHQYDPHGKRRNGGESEGSA